MTPGFVDPGLLHSRPEALAEACSGPTRHPARQALRISHACKMCPLPDLMRAIDGLRAR